MVNSLSRITTYYKSNVLVKTQMFHITFEENISKPIEQELTMIVRLFRAGLNFPGCFCSFNQPEQLWSIRSNSQKSVGKKISESP